MDMRPSLSRLRSALPKLKRWWRERVESSIPWLAAILTDPQPQALLLDEGNRVTVLLRDVEFSDARRETFDDPFDKFTDQQNDHIRALCAQRELSLSVAASQVYFLRILLPMESMRDLKTAIKYRLLADSPLKSDRMYFDAHSPITIGNDDGNMVDVVVCRVDSLDQLKANAARAGLEPTQVGLARNGSAELEFTFERAPGATTTSARLKKNIFLACGPVFILFLALIGSLTYAHWKRTMLLKEAAALSGKRIEVVHLLERRAHLTGIDATIKNATAKMTTSQLLNNISRALPQSAWLSEIRIDGDKLRLIGNATNPTATVASLATTRGLISVRLDGVTSDPATSQESRFEITAEISAK